jgi:DNA-binding transcriptional LysR family regulator
MQLRDLEYFLAIAKHGNLSRASEPLGLSPAALSKSLRRLEESVQARLVERVPKGVALTTAGAALLGQISRLKLTMEDVARQAADLSRGHAGHIRIGLSGADCEAELAAAYSVLLRDSPELTLELTASINDVMVPRLLAGELDMVINVIPAVPFEGTVHELLFEDEFVVFASTRHRLARRRNLSLADIAEERWSLSMPDAHSRKFVERVFLEHGHRPPRVAVEIRTVRMRLQMLARTELVAVGSRRVLRGAAKSFGLVQLPIKALTWSRPVGVIYRKDGYVLPAARRLVELLKLELRKTGG